MEEPPQLSAEQLAALARLSAVPELAAFYLAGGSGIAVHLAHRRSVDLDFFSLRGDVDLDQLGQTLKGTLPEVQVVQKTDATLQVLLGAIPIDFVKYPYPLLHSPIVGPEGHRVAALEDLAAMKLAAIARRGIRRDFWDLHEILTRTEMTLERALELYTERFGTSESDAYHVLKALTYFEDANEEPVYPGGLTAEYWNQIQEFFVREAPKLLR